MRLSQDTLVGTAVAASLVLTGGAAVELGVQAGQEAFGISPEERNAQVEACAGQLGEKAVRTMHLPDACAPFKTGFAFHDKWVSVRIPTHTNGLPAYDSWRRKVFDLPSTEAFRQAELEPVEENRSNRTAIAAFEGALGAFGLLWVAGTVAMLHKSIRHRDEKPTVPAVS